jgi:hypothetical protein
MFVAEDGSQRNDGVSVDGEFWYTKHVCYILVWVSLWN